MIKNQNDSGGSSLITPEQKANMTRFAKKNGVSEQKVQSQLSPKVVQQTKLQQPVQQQVQQPVQQQVQQQVQQPVQQPVQQQVQQPKTLIEEYETYFSYTNEDTGGIEIDLVTFREKGLETRYLSMLFSGIDIRQNPPTQQDAFLTIESKEDFERLKAFFAQLNWED